MLSIDFDMPWLLSFSPDNTLLAATSRNNNYVRLWDVSSVVTAVKNIQVATAIPLPTASPTSTETSEPMTQVNIPPLAVPSPESASIGPENISQMAQLGELSRGNILTAAWSPDGKTIAESFDNGVYTFTQGSTQPTHFFPTTSAMEPLSFSPDGSLLAGQSDTVQVWNVSSGDSLFTLEDSGCPWGSLSFSFDGKNLTAVCGDFTYLWNMSNGRLISKTPTANLGLVNQDNSLSVQLQRDDAVLVDNKSKVILQAFDVPGMTPAMWQFSPDGKTLMIFFYQFDVAPSGVYIPGQDFESRVQLWNIAPGQLPSLRATLSTGKWDLFTDQLQAPFEGFTFSPDSRQLATATGDGFVQLWNVNSGKLETTLPYPPANQLLMNGSEVLFSSNSQQLLAVGNTVQVWNISRPHLPTKSWNIPSSSGFGPLLTFTQGGDDLVTTTGSAFDFLEKNGTTYVENSPLVQIPNATNIESVSPDGKWLAYSTLQGILLGTNHSQNPNWQTLETFVTQDNGAQALAFSPDSSQLAAADPDGKVFLWHLSPSGSIPIQLASDTYIANLSFTPDNKYLLGSDGDQTPDNPTTMYLWDVANGSLLRTWKTMGGNVAFHPNGVSLVVGGFNDSTVRAYDLNSWTPLREFQGASNLRALTFNPDGSLLLAQCDGKILIWDYATGTLLREMDGYFSSAAFSPDGNMLVASLGDGRIQYWGLPVK